MRRQYWFLSALGAAIVLYALSRTQRGAEIAANIIGGGVDKLKEFLHGEEGYSAKVYLDNATPPVWTVGFGHAVLASDSVIRDGVRKKLHPFGPVQEITKAEADAFFKADTAIATQAVDNAVTKLATTNQRTAMISLAFNIGASAFRASTLVKLFNAGDIKGAADQFSRWIYSGDKNKPNPVLVARRERERQLFLKV